MTRRFGPVLAVDDVTLEVQPGELVTLLGPSGSGKTTLLNLVAGFDPPSAGEIYLGERRITGEPPNRRGIGMVFQDLALFPHLTVFENVAFPLRLRKVAEPEIRARVGEALALVRLDGLDARAPRQLSGGQQQRVALARALVFRPPLLLMDEPFGALDRSLRERMQGELRQLQRRLGITVLFVTHDQAEAMALSDRIVVIDRGRAPAGRPARGAVRGAGQPVRGRLHRRVERAPLRRREPGRRPAPRAHRGRERVRRGSGREGRGGPAPRAAARVAAAPRRRPAPPARRRRAWWRRRSTWAGW